MQRETLCNRNHVKWLAPSVYIYTYMVKSCFLYCHVINNLSSGQGKLIAQILVLVSAGHVISLRMLSNKSTSLYCIKNNLSEIYISWIREL